MEKTSIASRLEETFKRFDKFASARQYESPCPTVYDIWSSVFDPQLGKEVRETITDDDSRHAVVRRIMNVSDDMVLLREQIDKSTTIKIEHKRIHINKIRPFEKILRLENLNEAIFQKDHLNRVVGSVLVGENACCELGTLAYALEGEFSENTISKEDSASLVQELENVLSMLDEGSFDLGLTIRIKRKIKAVILCLEHPETVNLQDAFDELGGATLNASQLERLCPSEEGQNKARNITKGLVSAVQKLGTWVNVADVTIKLGHEFVKAVTGS